MAKILVIEDVAPLRSDMVEMLRIEGYDVREAENGLVGLEVAQEFRPDLIVCDIMMPKLDGYGVLRALRAQNDTRTLPFIFLTAKSERSEVRKGMGLGADDYLSKPFENEELLDAVRARLEQHDNMEREADERLARLRESITTALPHELRTPLNTIIGFSDMLLMEAPSLTPDEVGEWASHIHRAAQRLNRLVENYLTYVRIQSLSLDAPRLSKLRAYVTPNPHVDAEHQAMYLAQKYERIDDLIIEHGEQRPLRLNETDFAKIIDELVDNAFKFSDPGSRVELLTGMSPEGEDLYEIRVTDYGRGMRPEQVKTVGAYMQFDRLVYEQQGAGMGLAVAKGLTEIYLGQIRIESELGRYTSVIVTLPTA